MSLTFNPFTGKFDFTSGVQNPLSADLNFNHFKAVAMAVDQGATLPSSPITGQWFLHAPTGRSVLMMYNGTAWTPIISLGAITVYVDPTGTDTQNNGGAAGTSAFKTIGYAILQIPSSLSGNVVVNVAAGTYAENIILQGKNFLGSYTFTINGAINTALAGTTMSSGTPGTQTVQPTITKTTATWVVNQWANKIIQFTSGVNNGTYRVIDSNSATVLTLCGPTLPATPSANDTFTIFDQSTVISPSSGYSMWMKNQAGVTFNWLNLNGFRMDASEALMYYGYVTVKSQTDPLVDYSKLKNSAFYCLYSYWVAGNAGAMLDLRVSDTQWDGCKFSFNSGEIGILCRIGYTLFARGSVITGGGNPAVWVINGGQIQMWSAGNMNVFVRNNTLGVKLSTGSCGGYGVIAETTYSGNTTNYTADAATYCWVN